MALQRNIFRNASQALYELSHDVLHGREVGSRTGERTMELTNVSFTLTHPVERYLLNPGRRASLPAQIAETMWVLAGRNDIGWLSNYLPRAAEFSDDGETWRGGYGPRLRSWPSLQEKVELPQGISVYGKHHVDQLAHVVGLLRSDATTRRAVINLYDPAVDTSGGKDVPCNNWIQFLSRDGRLDAHVVIRSNDLLWGWSGINAFEWSVLLEIVAGLLGVGVGRLHFTIGSLHLYEKHWRRAREMAPPIRLGGAGAPQPAWTKHHTLGVVDAAVNHWMRVENRLRESPDVDHTSLIENIYDPLFREWAYALAWWWSDGYNHGYLDQLSPPVAFALAASPGRPAQKAHAPEAAPEAAPDPEALAEAKRRHPSSRRRPGHHAEFTTELSQLHAEKHAAYGDSWKRRGEMLGILANIARKVDRLGGADTSDETSADTAADLLIYLVKYRLWLAENVAGRMPRALVDAGYSSDSRLTDSAEPVAVMLSDLSRQHVAAKPDAVDKLPQEDVESTIITLFTQLEEKASARDALRYWTVDRMIACAYGLAYHLWVASRDVVASDLVWTTEPPELIKSQPYQRYDEETTP